MNFPNIASIFNPKPRTDEIIAGLRDQIIQIGTAVRFMEADKPVPQPRDDAGRFVSNGSVMRKRLEDATNDLTPSQREAAIARASVRAGKEAGR